MQHTLKYVARKRGLHRLGMHVMPTTCISAHKARQAIQMQLLCSSLCQTRWANDPWTLTDTSWERFETPPKDCFKKDAKVVEVIFDGDRSNIVWYTIWNVCYFLTENGWFKTRCFADSTGCYYTDMYSQKVYYQLFGQDAVQFSKTGTWEVLTEPSVISSSTHPDDVDCFDGIPPDFLLRRHSGEYSASTGPPPADVAEPVSPSRNSSSSHADGDSRSGLRGPSLLSSGGSRNNSHSPSRPGPSGCIPNCLAELPPGGQEEVPADSTNSSESTHLQVEEDHQLLKGSEELCLLVRGTVNKVKCFRHRCKTIHRHRYCEVTTTLQIVGEGSARKGQAMMLFTYTDRQQRENFLSSVTFPPGMNVKRVTMHAE